jgi:starch phosphorylase
MPLVTPNTHPLPKELICSNHFGTFFGVTQQVFDNVWRNLTDPSGNAVAYVSMEIGADPDVFHPLKNLLAQQEISVASDPQKFR